MSHPPEDAPPEVEAVCDECGSWLEYPGNHGVGYEDWCDQCYDRIDAMRW